MHSLGSKVPITNTNFKETYTQFLMNLAEKYNLDVEDYMILCQYLILQDRFEDANRIYGILKSKGLKHSNNTYGSGSLQLQFDYLTAYLDLELAFNICELYKEHPVKTWKLLFAEIRNLVTDSSNISQDYSSDPALSFSIKSDKLELNYQNIDTCVIKIYYHDLEILFSKNPFFNQDSKDFIYIKPNLEFTQRLTGNSLIIDLPNEAKRKALTVQIDYEDSSVMKTAFNSDLKTLVLDKNGLVKVADPSNSAKSTVYIKVFSVSYSGDVSFYKDGYTDVKGVFDYASLNYDKISEIEKFSILVSDEELGSVVFEVKPPKSYIKDL